MPARHKPIRRSLVPADGNSAAWPALCKGALPAHSGRPILAIPGAPGSVIHT